MADYDSNPKREDDDAGGFMGVERAFQRRKCGIMIADAEVEVIFRIVANKPVHCGYGIGPKGIGQR